jgi:hypothetical protein
MGDRGIAVWMGGWMGLLDAWVIIVMDKTFFF